jgi:hypothetical protein
MANVTAGYNWTSGEVVTPEKLNSAASPTVVVADNEITTAKILNANVTPAKLADGAVVQVIGSATSAHGTFSTALPFDDTVPTNTEGSEVIAASITPLSATNKVLVAANIYFTPNSDVVFGVALFRGTTCIFASAIAQTGQNYPAPLNIQFLDSPATATATTYSVRIGATLANTFYINGNSTGRRFGATPKTSITLTEIKAS